MATAGLTISYVVLGLVLVFGGTFFALAQHYRPIIVVRESVEDLKALKTRIVDEVLPGPAAPEGVKESEHNLMSRGSSQTATFSSKVLRQALRGSAFSYDMKVLSDTPMSLNCRFWGSERGGRTFDIIVEDQVLAIQDLNFNLPGHFFDAEYRIPASVTRGKSKVTVEFQAHAGQTAGGLFAVETLKR